MGKGIALKTKSKAPNHAINQVEFLRWVKRVREVRREQIQK